MRPSPSPHRASRRSVTWLAGLAEGALLKAYPVIATPADGGAGAAPARDAARRSPRQRDQAGHRPAREDAPGAEVEDRTMTTRFIGPVGLGDDVEIVLDSAVAGGAAGAYVTGANRPDEHLRGVVPGRDFSFREADVRQRSSPATRSAAPRSRADRPGDRDRQHLQARHALLGAPRRELPRRDRRASSRSGWAPTGSARPGSWPPPSSSTPTSTGSPGLWRSLAPFDVHLVTARQGRHAGARGRRPRLRGPGGRTASWR